MCVDVTAKSDKLINNSTYVGPWGTTTSQMQTRTDFSDFTKSKSIRQFSFDYNVQIDGGSHF